VGTLGNLSANADLAVAQADAEAAIELAPGLLGARFLVLAVSAAVLAGLDRDETPDSLRRLIDQTGVRYDSEFTSSSQLRYALGVLRAAAGDHKAAVEELRGCALYDPAFGNENPALLPWRSATALSLAQLGRDDEARRLAADELHRAESFGAEYAIGIALRAHALVGPAEERAERLERGAGAARGPPARPSTPALVDPARRSAAGQRTTARSRCSTDSRWPLAAARAPRRAAELLRSASGPGPTSTPARTR
jgi:hypothetical protein